MAKGQRLKNEIHAQCISCNTKRLIAYWDHELESYIYLCDESAVICLDCNSKVSSSSGSSSASSSAAKIALAV